jgi:plastocyanin
VWDLKSSKEITNVPVMKEITSMQMSYDGKVVTVTSGTQVHFWDTDKLQAHILKRMHWSEFV